MKYLLFIVPCIISCDNTLLQYDPYHNEKNIQCDWIQIYRSPTDDECFINKTTSGNFWNSICSNLILHCDILNYYVDLDLIICDDKTIRTNNVEALHCAN